ncbi:hypothetical protein C2845_PM11G20680 [Panicum miliaceum]|uniref:Uncharacterized protein n=1 Tax=Panicum miliaceum TaxID=4540 RepID=A0A3L6RVK6_PANMI|nr:hypothetical protein C2845_PM11G20680 [Panicum miliaceum]
MFEHPLRVWLTCITKNAGGSLRMLLLQLRNGELHTVYNFSFLGLPQTPRAHQEQPVTKTV